MTYDSRIEHLPAPFVKRLRSRLEAHRWTQMEPKLAEALGPFKDYFELQEDGKLTCLVNGHSFPAKRPEQIAAFVK